MLQDLGQKVRILREKKGITLNDYAKKLGVSSGYLSQLETGKSQKIDLELLDKLQEELLILPMNSTDDEEFVRVQHQYQMLVEKDQETAKYLLSSFENGILHFLSRKP